jgi:hypothetical protein
MREHRNNGAPVALVVSLTPFAALLQSIPSRQDRLQSTIDWRRAYRLAAGPVAQDAATGLNSADF